MTKARKFHGSLRFIDDLLFLNDGDDFCTSFKKIYPNELELKCEHRGEHATFLDLDIKINDGEFEYKLFDKRDGFPFEVIHMPNRNGYIPL